MKKIIAIFLVLTLFASSVFAQLPDEEKVKVGLTEFVTGLADTVPAVSTINASSGNIPLIYMSLSLSFASIDSIIRQPINTMFIMHCMIDQ